MCLSIRGAAYYAASLNISIALLFLGGFFIDLVGISDVWHNPYATYFSLILAFIYICLFLVFGLLIFRGVELESVRLLKGSVAGFLVLQISAFLVCLALLCLTHSKKHDELEQLRRKMVIVAQFENDTTTTMTSISSVILDGNKSDDVHLVLDDIEVDIQIITLMQVIALVFGILVTFCYVAVVVTYVRTLCPSTRRH